MKLLAHIHRHVWHPLLDVIFPPICFHCNTPLNASRLLPLCDACLDGLTPISPAWVQKHVVDRIEDRAVDTIIVALEFNAIIQSLIHHLKYQAMPGLGIRLGKWIAPQVVAQLPTERDIGLVPVPLHRKRQRERGYNQSEKIALGLRAKTGIPLLKKALKRHRHTRSQTTLNRQERQENVANAFRVSPKTPLPATIILVDDVVTTGATMNACAWALKTAGVQRVIGLAVATPRDAQFGAV